MYVCGIFLSHRCNLPERACVCVALITPMKVHPARKNTWAWSPDRTFSTAMGVWLLLITKATVQGGMPRLIGTRAATLISPARLSLLIMPAAAAARAVRRTASGGHKAPSVSGIPQGGTSDGTLMLGSDMIYALMCLLVLCFAAALALMRLVKAMNLPSSAQETEQASASMASSCVPVLSPTPSMTQTSIASSPASSIASVPSPTSVLIHSRSTAVDDRAKKRLTFADPPSESRSPPPTRTCTAGVKPLSGEHRALMMHARALRRERFSLPPSTRHMNNVKKHAAVGRARSMPDASWVGSLRRREGSSPRWH